MALFEGVIAETLAADTNADDFLRGGDIDRDIGREAPVRNRVGAGALLANSPSAVWPGKAAARRTIIGSRPG